MLKGLADVYFVAFIHSGTRQIWISPCTGFQNLDDALSAR